MVGLSPVQRIDWAIQYAGFLDGQSRFPEARSLLQTSLETARQANLKAYTARIYEILGVVEATASNHSLAVNYYLKALDLYQAQYKYDKQQSIYNRLRGEYAYIGPLARRQAYTRETNRLHQTYNQLSTLSAQYITKAEEFQGAGKTDSALVYFKKVMTVFWVSRDWPDYYSFLDGYGLVLIAAKRYKEAETVFRQCLAYSIREGDPRRELYEYMHLPEPLLKLNRLNEAQRYAQMALRRIENDPERQDQHRVHVYSLLTQIAETRSQFKQALAYERLSNQYLSRAQSVEKSRQLAEVEARYQSAQKQIRINELDQTNRRQVSQINWQANSLVILIGLLVLTLWQYRTIRRVNARLSSTNITISDKNQQISEQADKLSVLMQELHHRVKNNLAIVSSLLRMQSRRLNDPALSTQCRTASAG
jgi:tetratricopeptide (TPR) repeat protein